jgi:hypothetical protein
MNQHKQLKRIWELEWMLHRIKGDSNKHLERKVIMAELEQLSKEIKTTGKYK